MPRYTNDTDAPVVLPTLDPPVTLDPGESIDLPDPEPVVEFDQANETIAVVLDKVAKGELDPAVALAAEQQGKQRQTLITQLAELIHPED